MMSRPSAARRSFRIIASASPRSFTNKGPDSRSGSPSGARPITIPQGASRPTSSPRNRRMPRWRRRPNGAVTLSPASIVTEHFAHLVDLPDDQAGIEFGSRLFADPTTAVLSHLRGHARLRDVRADRGAAVLSAGQERAGVAVGWAKARKRRAPPSCSTSPKMAVDRFASLALRRQEATPKSPSPNPPGCAA